MLAQSQCSLGRNIYIKSGWKTSIREKTNLLTGQFHLHIAHLGAFSRSLFGFVWSILKLGKCLKTAWILGAKKHKKKTEKKREDNQQLVCVCMCVCDSHAGLSNCLSKISIWYHTLCATFLCRPCAWWMLCLGFSNGKLKGRDFLGTPQGWYFFAWLIWSKILPLLFGRQ